MTRKQIALYIILFTLVSVILSSVYLIYTWNRYEDEVSVQVIELADSIKSVIPEQQIGKLSGSAEDLDKPEYEMIKQNLMQLVMTNESIRFAYLMAERGDNIIILIDSESPDSLAYSPPGQIYEEASDIFYEPFNTGETIITEPTKDRFGNWVSVLVPIKDTAGNVKSVFGIDYSINTGIDNAITGDIISMAHKLGHCVVAEGVEFEEQKQYLQKHGCDKIQGYLISRPLDEGAAIEMLKNQTNTEKACHLCDSSVSG